MPGITGVQRVYLLGVPMDLVNPDDIDRIANEMARTQHHRIVFLTYSKWLRARRSAQWAKILAQSSLVLPVSRSLAWGCRFVRIPVPKRHFPFDFIIRFLGALEHKHHTLYLVGDRHADVQTITDHLRTSFPGLTLVGRHSGHFHRDQERDIVTAIHKATPTVLLAGPGIPSGDRWLYHQRLGCRIAMCSDLAFRIMSGRRRRPTEASFVRGTYGVIRGILNPLRWAKSLSYIGYVVRLTFWRLRHPLRTRSSPQANS